MIQVSILYEIYLSNGKHFIWEIYSKQIQITLQIDKNQIENVKQFTPNISDDGPI